MADGGSIDEKLASNDFVNDFIWAARTVFAQPSVAVVSIALMVSAVLSQNVPHGQPLPASFYISIPIMLFYLGWCGAERMFFLRRREGKAVTLWELLKSTQVFLGPFLRLGLLTTAVLLPPFFIAAYWALSHGPSQTGVSSHTLGLIGMLIMVAVDFVLTFVPSALVFTTRSAWDAIRIGVGMIRRTWPRSGLYVLCPPLALNMLNAIYPTDIRVVRVATTAALALLALLAKGATAAFYLRERPATSEPAIHG